MTNQLLVENQNVKNLNLFNETIEVVKGLQLFNYESVTWAGKDFNLVVDTQLLNPAFYIHEVYGGETLVKEIAFDHYAQNFYIRDTGTTLTQDEVIQHVNRGLITWVIGDNFEATEEIQVSNTEVVRSLGVLRTVGNTEFVEVISEVMSLMGSHQLFLLDYAVELYCAETSEKRDDITRKYTEYRENHMRRFDLLHARFTELSKKLKFKNGIVLKIARLLVK